MIFRGSQVAMVVAFFVLLVVVGTVGYAWIEGWNWADSFYMTIITITAVGYHEVHPLTQAGRYWTILMLIGGLTGLAAWFALITTSMVRMDLRNTYRKRATMKRIRRMKDHVIVCGGGRMGTQVIVELLGAKKDYVVIESDPEAAAALRNVDPDVLVIDDDAAEDRALRRAGIDSAMGLVTCLSADADNLFVCLSARHLNSKLVVIARAEGKSTTAKMYQAGADHVVSPNVTGAVWVASLLTRPSVASFLDVASTGVHLSRHIDQATVGGRAKIRGLTLKEARIPERTGLVVIAVSKRGSAGKDILFNPKADMRLGAGDDLIVLGDHDQVAKLRAYVS